MGDARDQHHGASTANVPDVPLTVDPCVHRLRNTRKWTVGPTTRVRVISASPTEPSARVRWTSSSSRASSPTSSCSGSTRPRPASCAASSSFARVITFDKRGQGLSDRPADPPTLENSMDDLHAVLDAAGSEKAGRVRGLRGRADVDAVRGHVPGAGLVADPLRDLREDDRGARPSLGRPGPRPRPLGRSAAPGLGRTGRV